VDQRESISTLLSEIDDITPGGFAIGLHVQVAGPTFLFQTFPQSWIDTYIGGGFQLKDPAVAWSLTNTGHVFWRDLATNDPANVMKQASEHGMHYGTTIAIVAEDSRSVLGCARRDRDYLLAEIEHVTDLFKRLHKLTLGKTLLPADTVETLRKMSIRLAHR